MCKANLTKKKKIINASSIANVDAIKKFVNGVKKIEKLKMKMTKRITFQMLQNEQRF